MKIILTACLAAISPFAFAQQVIDVDKMDRIPVNTFYSVGGEPVVTARFVRVVEGTPFFQDRWLKGLVISDKNTRYQNNRVKFNILDNEIHFLNEKGEEFSTAMVFKELKLTDTVFGTTYRFLHSSALPAFSSAKVGLYLQLVEGDVSLYQEVTKTIRENKPYGSAVTEQKIVNTEEYYLVQKGTAVSVKKPKDIPDILAGKKNELEAFLKNDSMRKASHAEMMKALVSYYNNLK
ncbi:MAG TPA: hypothetical protein VEX65_09185 [Flavisolibacter sp.]|nr:hypothetical protein [Flavisolibacter sp.]